MLRSASFQPKLNCSDLVLGALDGPNISQLWVSMLELEGHHGGAVALSVVKVGIKSTSGVALKRLLLSMATNGLSQIPPNECATGLTLEYGQGCRVPNVCNSDAPQRMLVTSETIIGHFARLNGADQMCQEMASAQL